MALKTGDKSRAFRQRRKKLARRVKMRALRKALQQEGSGRAEGAKAGELDSR